jgi:transcriptional regulator with XRE-family HTH domain
MSENTDEELTILDATSDFDTLGGRIVRAREALNLDEKEASRRVGVTLETYKNWETDRDEPRANKLSMLAMCLSVSPTWLLYGRGKSPISESVSEEVTNIREQLARVNDLQEQTAQAIKMLNQAVARLIKREQD